jgi:hypothetical protein
VDAFVDAFVDACFLGGVAGVARSFVPGRFADDVAAFVAFVAFVTAGRADGAVRAVGRFLAGMVAVGVLAVAAR